MKAGGIDAASAQDRGCGKRNHLLVIDNEDARAGRGRHKKYWNMNNGTNKTIDPNPNRRRFISEVAPRPLGLAKAVHRAQP
jgi:hypothetical protein